MDSVEISSVFVRIRLRFEVCSVDSVEIWCVFVWIRLRFDVLFVQIRLNYELYGKHQPNVLNFSLNGSNMDTSINICIRQ